jgi:hypothetical protein
MAKIKLHFAELFKASVGWLLYLNRDGVRRSKKALLNLMVVVMSLSLIISNWHAPNNRAVINPGMFPARTMAAMGSYPGSGGGGGEFIAIITLPRDGAMFATPANITIYASAANFGGSIIRLDFYANDTLLYSTRYFNYAFTWRGPQPGQYVLTVRAVNNKGQTTTSLPVGITVIDRTATGCTCAAGCSDRAAISPPFAFDGAGERCWETTSLVSYVNSWNLDTLLINGVGLKNRWTNKLPDKINGKYFIYYKSSNEWGHFEMK